MRRLSDGTVSDMTRRRCLCSGGAGVETTGSRRESRIRGAVLGRHDGLEIDGLVGGGRVMDCGIEG